MTMPLRVRRLAAELMAAGLLVAAATGAQAQDKTVVETAQANLRIAEARLKREWPAWLMPMPEQRLRFFDFGEISPCIEICEDRRERRRHGRRTTILDVKARKSDCAAQFEGLRLLASGDVKGLIESIFGARMVRRVATQ